MRLLYVLAWFALSAAYAAAHPGGLDANGCHNDRENGGYHCHRGPLEGRMFFSRSDAERLLKTANPPESKASTRTVSIARSRPPEDVVATRSNPVPQSDDRPLSHWIDADGDCQDTRQEVLIDESLVPAALTGDGCRVLRGLWFDPFTGTTFSDPSKLDVDHFIPLAEVHRSGGAPWTPEIRRSYANDLRHTEALMVVSQSANRSKGDQDPAGWLPPNQGYRCEYVRRWVVLKATWGLSMDTREADAVQRQLQACP